MQQRAKLSVARWAALWAGLMEENKVGKTASSSGSLSALVWDVPLADLKAARLDCRLDSGSVETLVACWAALTGEMKVQMWDAPSVVMLVVPKVGRMGNETAGTKVAAMVENWDDS